MKNDMFYMKNETKNERKNESGESREEEQTQ